MTNKTRSALELNKEVKLFTFGNLADVFFPKGTKRLHLCTPGATQQPVLPPEPQPLFIKSS